MKGSKLPKLAALLLVLTLATTCFVSGTFAKYVSEGEGKDAARVAKWGVKVEITGDGFKTTYGKDEVNANVDGPTVVSSTTEKVVAPGTSGTFGGISITGKPEVAVKIETTADVKLDGWNIAPGGEFYCPLVFTIGDTKINGLDYSSTTAGGEGSFESGDKDRHTERHDQGIRGGDRFERRRRGHHLFLDLALPERHRHGDKPGR